MVIRGLALFAAGNVEGAVRAWLAAKRDSGTTRQIETYLDQARRVAPALVVAMENEVVGGAPPEPQALATGPRVERAGAAAPVIALPTPAARPPDETGDFNLFASALIDVATAATREARRGKNGSATPAGDPWGSDALFGPTMHVAGGAGGGLAMVSGRTSAVASVAVPARELKRDEARLKDLLRLDDFTGALELAERILKLDPDHAPALKARTRSRDMLEQMHLSKLGDVKSVPQVLVAPDQMIWLDLDHRAGFILAQVDGSSSYDEIIELTGLDRLEALRILVLLVQKGIIGERAA